MGRPPHRRPQDVRGAAGLRGGDRALRAAVRGRRPRWSSTTSTPTTSRPGTRSPARASRPSRSSTTTRTSPPASPSTARPARRSARSTTAPATGSDGTVWGGELLVGDLVDFERAGHLWPVRLPGGDRAVRQPWRMACAWLLEAGWEGPLPGPDPRRSEQVAELVRSGLSSPVTTSMGRLFDAVAALCGLRDEVTYEGQAAVELEAAADPGERGRYELPVTAAGVLDARPTVLAVARDVAAGAAPGTSRRASTPRSRRHGGGGEPGRPRRRALGRRVPEPPLLAADGGRARGARAARARARAPAAQRRRLSYGQAAVAAAAERSGYELRDAVQAARGRRRVVDRAAGRRAAAGRAGHRVRARAAACLRSRPPRRGHVARRRRRWRHAPRGTARRLVGPRSRDSASCSWACR